MLGVCPNPTPKPKPKPMPKPKPKPNQAVLKSSGMPDKIIGEIPASGLIFKDIVKVNRPWPKPEPGPKPKPKPSQA